MSLSVVYPCSTGWPVLPSPRLLEGEIMAQDGFKLPTSSYDELVRILRGYLSAGDDASLDDVSKRTGLNRTGISANNAFLIEAGILEKGQKKSLTAAGGRLAQALEHEIPDAIRSGWQDIVSQTEFLDNIVSAVRIRNGMDREALTSHVAYSAGQKKAPSTMTGARCVVAILQASGLIEEADGKFVAGRRPSPPNRDVAAPSAAPELRPAIGTRMWGGGASHIEAAARQQVTISVQLEVSVQATPEELETLGPRIRQLLADLNSPGSDEAASTTEG